MPRTLTATQAVRDTLQSMKTLKISLLCLVSLEK